MCCTQVQKPIQTTKRVAYVAQQVLNLSGDINELAVTRSKPNLYGLGVLLNEINEKIGIKLNGSNDEIDFFSISYSSDPVLNGRYFIATFFDSPKYEFFNKTKLYVAPKNYASQFGIKRIKVTGKNNPLPFAYLSEDPNLIVISRPLFNELRLNPGQEAYASLTETINWPAIKRI